MYQFIYHNNTLNVTSPFCIVYKYQKEQWQLFHSVICNIYKFTKYIWGIICWCHALFLDKKSLKIPKG